MKKDISNTLYKEALTLMPGGVNSPVRAYKAVGQTPLFIDRAKGSHIYDADGNSYIDYVGSWGPNILGAANDEVVAAVKNAAEKGLTFGAPTVFENELATLIKKCYSAIERVRLVNSGTEAVMSAIRVARGFTGRDIILKFEGNYHGHSDGMLIGAGSGLLTGQKPDSEGVPLSYAKSTIVARYNDLSSVENAFRRYQNEIAAVIVEPVAANMGVVPPATGFLEGLECIAHSHGSLLIFDEVITGFRISLGGAASVYGIKPDIATLGKIVGGGMPLAAYGGRADVMSVVAPEGGVYQAGTLVGNPVAVNAGIATLKLLMADEGLYDRLDMSAKRIEDALKGLAGVSVNRAGSLIGCFFTDRGVNTYEDVKSADTDEYARFFDFMLGRGIYLAPSQYEAIFVSAAHTDEDIDITVKAIEEYAGYR